MIPNQDKITAFWREVSSTIDGLLDETDMHHVQELMSQYEDQLKTIDSNLTFHFERNEMNEQIEMVFGCDGYPQSIASVLTLVQAAPSLHGIQVVAFNPRHEQTPELIRVADLSFNLDDIFYQIRLESQELHLSVYIDNFTQERENPTVEAAMIFLDAILGEFDMMTRVTTLNFYPKPSSPEDYGLKSMRYLRDEFDQRREQVPLIGVTVH